MKKFWLGLLCGVALTATTTINAADGVWALLFPVKFQFDGESREIGPRYQVLNYEGHTYVPLRYMAEQLGAGAQYDPETRTISVDKEPMDGTEAEKMVWSVHYRLERGMASRDVKQLFGNPDQVTWVDSSNQQIWRFDFGAKPGYRFGSLNEADVQGLEKGELEAQLFVGWNSAGQVDRYDLWYVKTGTGGERRIYTYIVYPDGSTGGALYE
ncbi:Copper amine oxidase N-terminal domain-containing protein [Paenibacillus sp. UNCCL117]|uniref:stalk domain-containing protein n=1 Tax=unclassified Paenibacillus TaxID=185978 RepID=UPI000884DD1C|nr:MULTISPECIES: stalk domain-containing protein [unclassified Paenibacillus]SDE29983.1 Copper amine oxidase N-terminal domain-containing protein [Paenibacillus sp. cl123]SFW63156.1 Copper amine oxidase N-terminal domain-containing protein [Paenibacillus sp. UNCCL117]